MSVIPVVDPDDPRLDVYRHVKATNATRRAGLFVLEGEKLLDRLLASPHFSIASALADERKAARVAAKLSDGVPLYVVPHETIGALVGYDFHLGVLSCGVRRDWPEIGTVLRDSLATDPARRITLVVCPAVNDPENLGAIARIGDVFGVDAVLAGPGCPDPLSRRVLRVSMGAVLRLPVYANEDLAGMLDRLRDEFRIERIAAVAGADAVPLDRFERPERLALVLGNEAQGLSPEWLARCEHRVTIPMRPGADSLNVSVAAGILLYHLL
jgi:tRNA G18 (ribose-2'-O)-methylase SpoU